MGRAALMGLLLAAAGCGSLRSSTDPTKPKDLVCGKLFLASGTSEKLAAALLSAGGGDCVVAEGATYHGSFTVPTDVSLVANAGATVLLVGDSADEPALRVMGGPRSTIRDIKVASAAGVGIVVDPGPAFLVSVSVTKAGRSGLLASCSGAECAADSMESQFTDLEITHCGIGLWLAGARASVVRGRVAESQARGLTTGHGVIASHGAFAKLTGTVIEDNQELGILVDGANGTRVILSDVKVLRNQGRGVWAQWLLGSDLAPALVIEGTGTLIDANRFAGVGARESLGISIAGATISNTVKASIPVTLGNFEDVGEGVGLFAGTGATRLESVSLTGNFRSQVLVDDGAAGIHIVNPATVGGGRFNIVVQKTTAAVEAPADRLSHPAAELFVSAPTVPVQQK
ncbi:MAG: right-handed parallel beta-helix repeat-containing protein [Myxococcaceae bacterium]